MFKDNAKEHNISIFPLNTPYCILALFSSRLFFKSLTTVNESIILLNDEIILLIEIGIASLKIVFIVFLILVGL